MPPLSFRLPVLVFLACVVSFWGSVPGAGAATAATGPTGAGTGPTVGAFRFPTDPVPLDPAAQIGVTHSRAYVEQRIDPAAVDAYVKRFGVSTETARRRLVDQNLVVGLGAALKRDVGSDLGSVSYDNEAGRWVVTAVSASAREEASSLLANYGLEQASQVVATDVSADQLEAITIRLRAALKRKGLDGAAAVGSGPDVLMVDIDRDASTDTKGAIRKVVAEEQGSARSAISERRVAIKPTVSCAFPDCDTLVAGTQWTKASGMCTIAFYVSAPGGGGNPHMLTAGHCVNPNYAQEEWFACRPPASGGCFPYNTGVQSLRNYGGSSDNGLLSVGTASHPWPNGWGVFGGYFNWSVGGLSTLRYYYPEGTSPEIGAMVCKNGRTTGTTCGQVTSTNMPQELRDPANGNPVLTNVVHIEGMCTLPGDSGSPITRADQETAVGIISAGVCGQTDYEGMYYGVGEPIGRALNQLGVQIYGG